MVLSWSHLASQGTVGNVWRIYILRRGWWWLLLTFREAAGHSDTPRVVPRDSTESFDWKWSLCQLWENLFNITWVTFCEIFRQDYPQQWQHREAWAHRTFPKELLSNIIVELLWWTVAGSHESRVTLVVFPGEGIPSDSRTTGQSCCLGDAPPRRDLSFCLRLKRTSDCKLPVCVFLCTTLKKTMQTFLNCLPF